MIIEGFSDNGELKVRRVGKILKSTKSAVTMWQGRKSRQSRENFTSDIDLRNSISLT